MKTAAVIAEYNPFHAGHQYHLAQTRKETGADFILAIISGDFVQRGAPAICNKYMRARMALNNGADVVLELPVRYSLSSAADFAAAGIYFCKQLGCIELLSFGSESGNLSQIRQIAALELRAEQDSACQEMIRAALRNGFSYPAARANALSDCFLFESELTGTALAEFLRQPNNILALEYCKALLRTHSSTTPFTIKRRGAYGIDTQEMNGYLSAAAIRQALLTPHDCSDELMKHAKSQLPSWESGDFPPSDSLVSPDDFSTLLHYKLLSCQTEGFTQYLDCSDDLSDKIIKFLPAYRGFSDFCLQLKSKDLTHNRISRVLMHILLEIKREADAPVPVVPYARLLGFRLSAQPLLAQIKQQSSIPLLSKMADASDHLDAYGKQLLAEDVFAAEIYETVRFHKTGAPPVNEYRQSPIILS